MAGLSCRNLAVTGLSFSFAGHPGENDLGSVEGVGNRDWLILPEFGSDWLIRSGSGRDWLIVPESECDWLIFFFGRASG